MKRLRVARKILRSVPVRRNSTPAALKAIAILVITALLGYQVYQDATGIRVIDGDTVVVDGEKVRFPGIDAPEISSPRCPAEERLGQKAKARVQELVDGAKSVKLKSSGERDVYGRLLGDLLVDGTSISAILLKEGLALPYQSGERARAGRVRVWCKGSEAPRVR